MKLATRLKLVMAAVVVVAILAVVAPLLGLEVPGGSPRTLPTLDYEGTLIVFPDTAPEGRTYGEAQQRPDKAVLVLRWQGARLMHVEWHVDTHYRQLDVPAVRGRGGVTTFSVIVDARPGLPVGIAGRPDPSRAEGLNECQVIHRSVVVQALPRPRGATTCTYLIPA